MRSVTTYSVVLLSACQTTSVAGAVLGVVVDAGVCVVQATVTTTHSQMKS
jgi:hypothetical protein